MRPRYRYNSREIIIADRWHCHNARKVTRCYLSSCRSLRQLNCSTFDAFTVVLLKRPVRVTTQGRRLLRSETYVLDYTIEICKSSGTALSFFRWCRCSPVATVNVKRVHRLFTDRNHSGPPLPFTVKARYVPLETLVYFDSINSRVTSFIAESYSDQEST